jgi:hypothetical protein
MWVVGRRGYARGSGWDDSIPPLRLRAVERGVSGKEQGLRGGAVLGQDRNADGNGEHTDRAELLLGGQSLSFGAQLLGTALRIP